MGITAKVIEAASAHRSRNTATLACPACGKEMKVQHHVLKRTKRKTCSRACRSVLMMGEGHWRYKGGFVNGDGYRVIYVDGKRVLEHRHVMEQILGRKLFPNEVVHHLNHDKLDNRPENLVGMSQGRHVSRHSKGAARDANGRYLKP